MPTERREPVIEFVGPRGGVSNADQIEVMTIGILEDAIVLLAHHRDDIAHSGTFDSGHAFPPSESGRRKPYRCDEWIVASRERRAFRIAGRFARHGAPAGAGPAGGDAWDWFADFSPRS